MSKVDYAKIRQDNIEEYGKGTRHLSYFADIYSTRTHFIFEILQNAEDALSRRPLSNASGYVRFHLHPDRLEISHNGKPFDDRDIVGICGIGEGTKAGDYTQIGKFGIGFKSVYAYSFFPQIHSETEHFKISRFVEPHEIEPRNSQDTLIVLPFDQPDTRPEWAFRDDVIANVAESEISRAITKLNIRTLLFLRQIETIEWILPNGKQGCLTKQSELEDTEHDVQLVNVRDHQDNQEQWRIFTRTVAIKDGEKQQQATVEVAFLLDENGKVTRASDTELVISFPTEKKTELGFLIQAPFKATKSRDNIKSDDPANHQMIQTAAQLAADGLSILRDTNRLAVSSYNALPLDEDDFPEDSFFRPVYDRVREALKTQSLLPAHGGNFLKSENAKLALRLDFVKLFSSSQISELFGVADLNWLDIAISSENTNSGFKDYLIELIDDVEVDPSELSSKLTSGFFSQQTVDWLIQFITYAEDADKSFRKTPFIRLQSGKQVALPENTKAIPTAWFAPDKTDDLDLSAFPLVHTELAANESVKAFLEKEGIREIDAVDMVVESILPKYEETQELNLPDYLNDLHQIAKAYSGDDEIKKKLEEHLKQVAWLACIQAGENTAQEIVWRKPKPYSDDLFAKPEELELSFSELEGSKIYFLHPLFEKQFDDYPSFKNYLIEKCIRKLDSVAIVEKVILPKYKIGDKTFDESEYRSDLQWILKARHVSGLKQTRWLACVHASGNRPDEIEWKRSNANESDSPAYPYSYGNEEFETWRKESTIYERNNDHETWFGGLENVDAYFLHPSVERIFEQDQLRNLVKPILVLTKNLEASDSKTVTLSNSHSNNKRGLHGFRPDAEIIGLNEALAVWHIDRFRILWDILLKSPRIISGETQFDRNVQRLDAAPKKLEYTKVGELCRKNNWIPDKTNNWHEPSKLLLADLPDEFDTYSVSAREVAEKLGMKKPEVQQAINAIAGDDQNKLSRLERFLSASEAEQEKMLKIIPQEISPQPAPSFKEGLGNLSRPQRGNSPSNNNDNSSYPINNPDRYQDKLNQETAEKVTRHQTTAQTVRFTPVQQSPSNKPARDFLYQQYQGKCQITGHTFPKASANVNGDAENYFEACALLSYSNAIYFNDAGNMLCVSADTMAMLKHGSFEWQEELESVIENFNNRQSGEIENVTLKIQLTDEKCQITWSERHFARLVALWDQT